MKWLVLLLESSCDAWHESATLVGAVKLSVRDHVTEILSRVTAFAGEHTWAYDNK